MLSGALSLIACSDHDAGAGQGSGGEHRAISGEDIHNCAAGQFGYPTGVAIDSAGNVFYGPASVAIDSNDNLYVADAYNHTIRKIGSDGTVSTLAGAAGQAGWADGLGKNARFNNPAGVATDAAGNVYVADSYNHIVRKITPAGVVSTLAGSAEESGSGDGVGSTAHFDYPTGIATDSASNIYVADGGNSTIRKITPAGTVSTLAGAAGRGGWAGGASDAARFNHPMGIATDHAGNLYVADTYNNAIRKVTSTGVVSTLAGTARQFGSIDGSADVARFDHPFGVAIDPVGNVYVADTYNDRIRRISPDGMVTTVAGTPHNREISTGDLSVCAR